MKLSIRHDFAAPEPEKELEFWLATSAVGNIVVWAKPKGAADSERAAVAYFKSTPLGVVLMDATNLGYPLEELGFAVKDGKLIVEG